MQGLGGGQNGLIDRLVGWHHQELWLIVILTVSKIIFIIYLYRRLLLLRLGGGV